MWTSSSWSEGIAIPAEMGLLLDASVWVAAATPNHPFQGDAVAVLRSDERFAALDFTLLEVANAIGVRYGMPKRASRLCELILESCEERMVRLDPSILDRAVEIAAEHGITAYDAAYVAAARRESFTLVSVDLKDLVSKGLAVAPEAAV